jgi:glyoxylase-like metal-dependent hydrolase (beta-lactamase superfamily II)
MTHYLCTTCGTQFAATETPPAHCPICEDERQYIGWQGQQWTTLDALRQTHQNEVMPEEPGLTGIGTQPTFAIGQRALLVQTPAGNVLWDCISLIDEATVAAVQALGGISAIAISHPHYYSSLVEWSRAFAAPVYLHAADRQWVMRPDDAIHFWEGETQSLPGGLTLIRCGGHFAGGTVLHWPAGAEGRGVLLTGDILQVVSDRRYVSFMYSYPNLIPLPAATVRRIVAAVEPYAFDRIYGAWWGRVVMADAKAAVARSAERYIAAIQGEALP